MGAADGTHGPAGLWDLETSGTQPKRGASDLGIAGSAVRGVEEEDIQRRYRGSLAPSITAKLEPDTEGEEACRHRRP